MKNLDLLDAIAVQRHDFLNHLQVIWGFSQLGKPEKVDKYMEVVLNESEALGRIIHLNNQNLAMLLLIGIAKSKRALMDLNFSVDNFALKNCPDEFLTKELLKFWEGLLDYLKIAGEIDKKLNFSLTKKDEFVKLSFSFVLIENKNNELEEVYKIWQDIKRNLENALVPYKGYMNTKLDLSKNKESDIEIYFPINLEINLKE